MKILNSLLKISAKHQFQKYKKQIIFCGAIDHEIRVSKTLLHHIVASKSRSLEEISERLAIFPLLAEILEKGIQTESRENSQKISLKIGNHILSVILSEQKNGIFVISCFRDTKKATCLSL